MPVTRITGRGLRRTRAGSRRATYRPAIDVMLRVGDPLRGSDLDEHVTPATREQIDVLAAALELLEERASRPALRHSHGQLVCGPVIYDHLAGVGIDGHLVTSVEGVASALDAAAAAGKR